MDKLIDFLLMVTWVSSWVFALLCTLRAICTWVFRTMFINDNPDKPHTMRRNYPWGWSPWVAIVLWSWIFVNL